MCTDTRTFGMESTVWIHQSHHTHESLSKNREGFLWQDCRATLVQAVVWALGCFCSMKLCQILTSSPLVSSVRTYWPPEFLRDPGGICKELCSCSISFAFTFDKWKYNELYNCQMTTLEQRWSDWVCDSHKAFHVPIKNGREEITHFHVAVKPPANPIKERP